MPNLKLSPLRPGISACASGGIMELKGQRLVTSSPTISTGEDSGVARLVPGPIFFKREAFLAKDAPSGLAINAKAGGAEDQIQTITTGNDAYRRLIYFLMKVWKAAHGSQGQAFSNGKYAVLPSWDEATGAEQRSALQSMHRGWASQEFDFSPVTTILQPFSPISQLQGFDFSSGAKKPRFILSHMEESNLVRRLRFCEVLKGRRWNLNLANLRRL